MPIGLHSEGFPALTDQGMGPQSCKEKLEKLMLEPSLGEQTLRGKEGALHRGTVIGRTPLLPSHCVPELQIVTLLHCLLSM